MRSFIRSTLHQILLWEFYQSTRDGRASSRLKGNAQFYPVLLENLTGRGCMGHIGIDRRVQFK
jgi:hypothetical protein